MIFINFESYIINGLSYFSSIPKNPNNGNPSKGDRRREVEGGLKREV
jgi:hypothetical protein